MKGKRCEDCGHYPNCALMFDIKRQLEPVLLRRSVTTSDMPIFCGHYKPKEAQP